MSGLSRAVFIDGLRTPFQLPHTGYRDMAGTGLLSALIRCLLARVGLEKQHLDHVVVGNVLHEPSSPNIAAAAAALSGVAAPAHSVAMACVSGQAALAKGIDMINSHYAEVVLVGGVEYLTDYPVLHNRKVRKALLKVRSPETTLREKVRYLSRLRPRDVTPEVIRIVEFQTGETFVENGDKIAEKFGVSRWDQDDYGYRSHRLANRAAEEGRFGFISPVHNPSTDQTISSDGTLRKWTREELGERRPVRPSGTVTAATANQPCDGAAVCLLTSESAAERYGLTPRARLSRVLFAGSSPHDALLMGTAHSLARLKLEGGVAVGGADVFELYEGFGGEVLAQLAALSSPGYAERVFGAGECIADIDIDKLNTWGGTIGLGHPFGATGIRLLLHTVGRLEAEEGVVGVVAGCAGGGLGAAFTVRNLQG